MTGPAWTRSRSVLVLLATLLVPATVAASVTPRLVRVAADPSQHRLLTPETRAARDANLVSSYAELVSHETGMEFREQRLESTQAALQALCDGRSDLMLLLGTLDSAPCATLVASPPYYRGQALLASRHTQPNPPEFAHLRRVAVIAGSRYAEWLATYHPHLQVVALPTLREVLSAVETGWPMLPWNWTWPCVPSCAATTATACCCTARPATCPAACTWWSASRTAACSTTSTRRCVRSARRSTRC